MNPNNKGFDFDLNELNITEMFNQIGKALETNPEALDLIKQTEKNIKTALENRDTELIQKTIDKLTTWRQG